MMIHKIRLQLQNSEDYNYIVVETFGLDTQLKELTKQNSIKIPKVVEPRNKKPLS